MMNRKAGTEKALNNYFKKALGQGTSKEPSRKNKKPEKKTEDAVLHWAKANGFFLHIVDSSSYDLILQKKGMARAAAGLPDAVGNTPNGLSCWIELKAKDRRSTLSESQRHFLMQKILQNCFAVVVDSEARLDRYWRQFCALKSSDDRQAFLLDCLPRKNQREARDDFEKNHGF